MIRLVCTVIVALLLWAGFRKAEPPLSPEHPVAELLETLGDKEVPHHPNTNVKGMSVELGRDIVVKGFSKNGKRKSKRQSKHFTCIACHNIEREEPDLAHPNPNARLKYAVEHDLPYLQGSPLYGIVNRTSFYNGDYVKKYGALVEPTRHDLREAIALCAIECSQGRPLKTWEMESIVAYLWTIGLKLGDLDISEAEMDTIQQAFNDGTHRGKAIRILKSKYLDYSPATFVDPPQNRETGDGLEGNPRAGKWIYEQSCQHCHLREPFSYLTLDNDKVTFQHMLNQAGKYAPHSIYQVVRYGTPPKGGKGAYMPHYTAEKMTDQQMADLRAYIELMAE